MFVEIGTNLGLVTSQNVTAPKLFLLDNVIYLV